MPLSILLLGGSSRLGTAMQRLWPDLTVYAPTRSELDPFDQTALTAFLTNHPSDWMINTIAHTAVDLAEQSEGELAKRLNTELPQQFAALSAQYGIRFLQISTDYVFAGDTVTPYQESDVPTPINVYGATKAEGEQLLLEQYPQSYIVRTSRLFGRPALSSTAKKSFIDLIIRDAQSAQSFQVNHGEYALPTYVDDLVTHIRQHLLEGQAAPGVYHMSNSGQPVTWYEWAQTIIQMLNLPVEIQPRDPATNPRPARRPAHLQLISTKIPAMRPWQEAQQAFFAAHPPTFTPLWQPSASQKQV